MTIVDFTGGLLKIKHFLNIKNDNSPLPYGNGELPI